MICLFNFFLKVIGNFMNFKPFLFSLCLSSILIYGCGEKDSTSHGGSNNTPKTQTKPGYPVTTPTPLLPPYISSSKYLNIDIQEYCNEVKSLESPLNLVTNKIDEHITTLENINEQYYNAQREIMKANLNKPDDNARAQIKALTSKIRQINSILLPSKDLKSHLNLYTTSYFTDNLNRCKNNNTLHLKELIINQIKTFEAKLKENNTSYLDVLIQKTDANIQDIGDKNVIKEKLNQISIDLNNLIEKFKKLNQTTENE